MNEIQEKKVVYFLRLSNVFEANAEGFFDDKDVLKDVNIFNARLDSLQRELINAAEFSNEITTEITIVRSLVIKLCNEISQDLKSYAKNNNFALLTRDLYVDYGTLSDAELLDYSKQIYEEALDITQKHLISELNVNVLKSFKNLIDNLRQIVTVPGMMFNFRAKTSEAFDDNILQNEILLESLDKILKKKEHQNFNSEYQSVKELSIR